MITIELDYLPKSMRDPVVFEQLVAEVEAYFVTASQEKRLTIQRIESEYWPFSRNLIFASVPICQYITDARLTRISLCRLHRRRLGRCAKCQLAAYLYGVQAIGLPSSSFLVQIWSPRRRSIPPRSADQPPQANVHPPALEDLRHLVGPSRVANFQVG